MIESSRYHPEIKESRRRWDCGMDGGAEWTYEGGTKRLSAGVVADGDSARYKRKAHVRALRVGVSPIKVVPQEYLSSCPCLFRGEGFFI